MKLIIELDEYSYEHIKQYYESHETVESTYSYIYHGIPLEDVKAEITALRYGSDTYKYAIDDVIEILDNIGKESGVKPTEKKRNCKDCPYYVLQDTRTNWGNTETTKIYGCSRWECIEDEKGEE